MKIWTITTSQADDETRTEIHTNEADAVAHHARIVAASWQSWFGEDKPMPDDTNEAWGILTCQPGFFDTVDLFVHEVEIPHAPASQTTRDLVRRADALEACQKVADEAKSYGIPQMAMGAHACRDAIRAMTADPAADDSSTAAGGR